MGIDRLAPRAALGSICRFSAGQRFINVWIRIQACEKSIPYSNLSNLAFKEGITDNQRRIRNGCVLVASPTTRGDV